MNNERYDLLMSNDLMPLTACEIRDRWHFCPEFDGLLIGPGMRETKFCQCFPRSAFQNVQQIMTGKQ